MQHSNVIRMCAYVGSWGQGYLPAAAQSAQLLPFYPQCPCKVERMVRFLAYLEDWKNISIHI